MTKKSQLCCRRKRRRSITEKSSCPASLISNPGWPKAIWRGRPSPHPASTGYSNREMILPLIIGVSLEGPLSALWRTLKIEWEKKHLSRYRVVIERNATCHSSGHLWREATCKYACQYASSRAAISVTISAKKATPASPLSHENLEEMMPHAPFSLRRNAVMRYRQKTAAEKSMSMKAGKERKWLSLKERENTNPLRKYNAWRATKYQKKKARRKSRKRAKKKIT